MGGIGQMADTGWPEPVGVPMCQAAKNRIVDDMHTFNTIATMVGVVIGAAFLLAGGVLLPIWEQSQTRADRNEARK